eukprot:8599886-Alexandrium_andersonii.AAC.1
MPQRQNRARQRLPFRSAPVGAQARAEPRRAVARSRRCGSGSSDGGHGAVRAASEHHERS